MITRTGIVLSVVSANPGVMLADIAAISKLPIAPCASMAFQLCKRGLIHRIGARHYYAYYLVREEALAAEAAHLEKIARQKADVLVGHKIRSNKNRRVKRATKAALQPPKPAKPPKILAKKKEPVPGKMLVVKAPPKPTPPLVIKESKIPFADRPVVMLPTTRVTIIPTRPGRFEIAEPVEGAGFLRDWQMKREQADARVRP